MEYIIYCDESDAKGQHFSNFYGGLLVRSCDLKEITDTLVAKKEELNLFRELKWQRLTSNYLDKYMSFTEILMDFIADGKIKVRIMFTHNRNVPPRYDSYRNDNKYFLLYYQFIKHIFGFQFVESNEKIRVRLYLDKMPDTKDKIESFKGHVLALNKTTQIRTSPVFFDKEQMAEIDSKEHVLAQSLDILLGAMQFRLNDKHKEKPDGQRIRGKRTIAKEKLYKQINKRIRDIRPNFNIGVSTGDRGDKSNRWKDHYRHWIFTAQGAVINDELGKKK